jgi:hypothetical protein
MLEMNSPLLERVKASYKELSAAAANLNSIFDELAKTVDELDTTLEELNLGITAWVQVAGRDEGRNSWRHDLGYDKFNNKWRIAIRTRAGNPDSPGQEQCEVWIFNEASRRLRIEAVEKLPELCDALAREAASIGNRLKGNGASPRIATWQTEIDTRCPTCLETR